MIRHFKVKTLVCINKYDLDEKKSKEMEHYRSEGIDLVGKIPFDEEVVKALAKECLNSAGAHVFDILDTTKEGFQAIRGFGQSINVPSNHK